MHLLPYNYFADRQDNGLGLLRLADLISSLRQTAGGPTLLCDNGDFLQGNPLADYVATSFQGDETHPMVAEMNALGFDAVTLGNHEFDFGLTYLQNVLKDTQCAVVSANFRAALSPEIAQAFTILTRDLPCDDGVTRTINIGITGFAPPRFQDAGDAMAIHVEDIVTSAQNIIPKMKNAGADIIVALAHCGIGQTDHTPMMENAAVPLAAVEGVDALLLGHTHAQFPQAELDPSSIIDPVAGTIHGTPAVMGGFYGQSLGVIDLNLGWYQQAWRVTGSEVRVVQPDQAKATKFATTPVLDAAHSETLTQMRAPIAQTRVPVQNHLATIVPDHSMQLLAEAMIDAARIGAKTEAPIIAAVAPFRFGGRFGLGQYINIPPGPITLRHAAAIFPFSDHLCAVRRSGIQIRNWLERSAAHYGQIAENVRHQPLINPLSAHYNCDALFGLTYDIDLRQPSRFDVYGTLVNKHAYRISNIALDGVPLDDDGAYTVATNSFRKQGGGNFEIIPPTDTLWTSGMQLRDILIAALRQQAIIDTAIKPIWRFLPIEDATAQFDTETQPNFGLPQNITLRCAKSTGLSTFDFQF